MLLCRHIAGIKPSVLFQKYSQSASESVNFIYRYVSHLSSNQLHLIFLNLWIPRSVLHFITSMVLLHSGLILLKFLSF